MIYENLSTSPDGNYILKASVYSFWLWKYTGIQYDYLSIVDANIGSIIALTKEETCNFHKINWSSDSQYAVSLWGDGKYLIEAIVMDIPDKTISNMSENIHNIIKETYDDSVLFERYHDSFVEWISNEQGKFSFSMNKNNGFISGWYIYDFTKDEIVDYEYEISE